MDAIVGNKNSKKIAEKNRNITAVYFDSLGGKKKKGVRTSRVLQILERFKCRTRKTNSGRVQK